jgi:hypothetical protein
MEHFNPLKITWIYQIFFPKIDFHFLLKLKQLNKFWILYVNLIKLVYFLLIQYFKIRFNSAICIKKLTYVVVLEVKLKVYLLIRLNILL